MQTIETAIDIAAPPARVWAALTAFGDYPAWNPFIVAISGVPRAGERLRIEIRPPGQSALRFRPTVLTAIAERQLTWLGHLFVPGLFDGHHQFRLESKDGACRLHQTEDFSGILVPLFGTKLLTATKLGFEAMNRALKQKTEA